MNQNFLLFSIFFSCERGKAVVSYSFASCTYFLSLSLSLTHTHTHTTHTSISHQSQGTFQSSLLDNLKMETDGLPYIRKWGATYPCFAHSSLTIFLSPPLSLSLSHHSFLLSYTRSLPLSPSFFLIFFFFLFSPSSLPLTHSLSLSPSLSFSPSLSHSPLFSLINIH